MTQREIEAVEARVGHSLRAPAKRPRVIKVSPGRSPVPEVISMASNANELREEPQPVQTVLVEQEPTRWNHTAAAPSRGTTQSDAYHTAPEDSGPSRRRLVSEVRQTTEAETTPGIRPSAPPHFGSFGYVTNHGQYRCALCLSQLPSQEDLTRHEQVSKEHLRNLQMAARVAKGREKLAQVTAAPEPGKHHTTPVPLQPSSANNYEGIMQPLERDDSSNSIIQAPITVHDTPETIEVRRHSVSPTLAQSTTTTPAPQPEPNALDKGKGRAVSIASTISPAQPLGQFEPLQLRTPSHPPFQPDTRPTTACTEIGTLYTPHLHNSASMAPPQQAQDTQLQGKGSASAFSATEMADIIRSTELIVQLMGCVQREAKAVAEKSVESGSFDSGVGLTDHASEKRRNTDQAQTSSASASETLSGPSSSSRVEVESAHHARLQAPGIEVYHGMKRKRGDMSGQPNGKRKDTGSEVSFIVLE